MKKITRKIYFVIAIVLLINLMSVITFSASEEITEDTVLDAFNDTVISENIEETTVENVETEATQNYEISIEENFTDDKVLVFINREYSAIKQQYTTEDFPFLELEKIEVLREYNAEKTIK